MFKSKNVGAQGSARKNHIPPIVLVGAVAFVGILVTCFIHIRIIRDNLKDVISEQYQAQLLVTERAMGERMNDIQTNVDGAAKEIEEKLSKNYSDAQIVQTLAKFATSDDIQDFVYINKEGIVLFPNGETKDGSKRMTDMNEIEDGHTYIVNDFFKDQSDYMILYLKSVEKDGQKEGIVVALQDCKHMIDTETFSNLEGIGDIYVLDRSAHILATSYPVDTLHSNYASFVEFSSKMYHMNDKALAVIQTENWNATSEGNTVVCFDKDGTPHHFAFASLSGYDDVIVSVVYTDDVFQESESGIVGSTVITAAIIIVLMILLLLVELWNSAKANKMIERYAFEDEITGGKNLNYFKKEADEILKRYKGMAFSVHRFDVCNFRYINEAYGHEKADQLLIAIAEEAAQIFSSNEICVRMNADQHVLLTKNTLDLEERLFMFTDKVNARALDIGIRYPIKFKRGVYKIQDTGEDIARIIDKANAARKELTGEEKECVATYSDKMVKDMRKVDDIESTMESALFNGEFKMFVQPKWDIIDNHLYGGEALVRWIRSDGTMVYPSDFVPVFERNGFVEQLDMFMLECACKLIRQLVDAGKPVYPISVNQSRVLIHNSSYLEKVTEVMQRYDVPKGSIELEVTETVLYMEQGKMLSIMNSLKSEDIPISMDDFGSGYSSLNMLKDFPFDVLKIDKEFFSESITSDASILILTKIVEMAHGLGIKVICEGVETKDQVEMLKKIGVRYVQGYYFSKPIPNERFLEQFCELDLNSATNVETTKKNEEKAKELVAAELDRQTKLDSTVENNPDDKKEEN